MRTVVAAVIERGDRRMLIGQRRKNDSSPLKWEFPGGKVKDGESPEVALARELQEELGVTLVKSVELGRVRHQYAGTPDELEIRFFAAAIAESGLVPHTFEKITWALPKELGEYDFLAANRDHLEEAEDEIRTLIRSFRHLRPQEDDTFSIISSDSLVSIWDQLTGTIAAVAVGVVSVFIIRTNTSAIFR